MYFRARARATHTHTHVHAHTCTHTRAHTLTLSHPPTHTHTHTHTHTRIYTHTHTSIHTHTHTQLTPGTTGTGHQIQIPVSSESALLLVQLPLMDVTWDTHLRSLKHQVRLRFSGLTDAIHEQMRRLLPAQRGSCRHSLHSGAMKGGGGMKSLNAEALELLSLSLDVWRCFCPALA
jgi:hypothetical protein